MKNFIPKRQLPRLPLLSLLAKCLIERKNLINSQTNNKFPGNDGLSAEFDERFSNLIAADLLDIYDSCRKLGAVGVLEQESYLSYIKKEIRNILQTADSFDV